MGRTVSLWVVDVRQNSCVRVEGEEDYYSFLGF
jgi:hypothetical protein